MKTNDFERILNKSGFALVRNSKHRIFSNGLKSVAVPQGKVINRMVARRILKEINYQERVEELNFG